MKKQIIKVFKAITITLAIIVILVSIMIFRGISMLNPQYDVTTSKEALWHAGISYTINIKPEYIKRKVIVAVVDTGTDKTDFSYSNLLEGYNAVSNSTETKDAHGHGKVCAHLIASPSIGVNPYAYILPVKVRTTIYDNPKIVSKGIKWAADNGADIINLSIGRAPTENNTHEGYTDGVEYALSKGKLLIAASGSSGTEVFFPASIEGVICVGGLNSNLQYTYDFNVEDIDIFAVDTKNKVSSSFPTAIVSGAVSLLMSLNEELTAREAMEILLNTADIIDISGKQGRLLNIDNAIKAVMNQSTL